MSRNLTSSEQGRRERTSRTRSNRRRRGDQLIFVGGAPRSGTTLLQNMLDSHPRVCGAPEFRHTPDLVRIRNELRRSFRRGWINDYVDIEGIDAHIGSFLEALILPFADRYDAEIVSEKTPQNVLVFRELLEIFPGTRLIFVLRDPRAVVASLLQVGIRGRQIGSFVPDHATSVNAAARYTRQCMESGFDALGASPMRVLLVRYEELVTRPEENARRICRFLGLEWSQRMLTPSRFRHPGESAIVNDIWYSHSSFYRDPSPDGMDRWRTELSAGRQLAVVRSFQRHTHSFPHGYNFSRSGFLTSCRARLEYGGIAIADLLQRGWRVCTRLLRGPGGQGVRNVARLTVPALRHGSSPGANPTATGQPSSSRQ